MDLRLFPRRRGLFRRRQMSSGISSPDPSPNDEESGVSIAPPIPTPRPGPNPAEELVRNYVRSMADLMRVTVAEVRRGKPARKYAASMGIDIDAMTW